MSAAVLVLRPEPGASRTAERLAGLGLEPIRFPLFTLKRGVWAPPDPGGYDAILLTSANAVRLGGPGLAVFHQLPAYAVGAATARAARDAGFRDVRQGGGDVAATVPLLADAGHAHVLHPCGEDVRPYDALGLRIDRLVVYRAVPLGDAAGLAAVLPQGELWALVHSPRAGERLAALVSPDARIRIGVIAISAAAADACGPGWRAMAVAGAPNENALLQCLQMLV
ncbi:MAG TPA: uroporphyrinogen-III synthase [Sphingobium sp.]|nr:uroporphyrinogen-III synthase [Sphingobium sp.]